MRFPNETNDAAIALAREVSYQYQNQIKALRWLKDIVNREYERLAALSDVKADGSLADWPKDEVRVEDVRHAMMAVTCEVPSSLIADIIRAGTTADAIGGVFGLLK